MSEDALRRILERVNSDDTFREQLTNDPEAALEGEDLSPVEVVALTAGDEDALRRLAGIETVGFALGRTAEVTKNTVATYPDGWTKTKAAARGGAGGGAAGAGAMPEVMGFCFGC